MSESGMQFIEPPQPNDRVVATEVTAKVTADDMKALIERMQPIVDRGEKANLFIDMKGYDGAELGVTREKFKHMGTLWNGIDKFAVVGAPRWMEIWSKVANPITPQHIQSFQPDKAEDAWTWLNAD